MSYVKVKEEETTFADELTEVENTAVSCDCCGETFEDDYGPSFVDEVEADDAIAENKGWVKVTEDNGEVHHYCEKCRIDNKEPSDVIQ